MSGNGKQARFGRDVAALYSGDDAKEPRRGELRRAELKTLADAFLGEDYDIGKLEKVIALQDRIFVERERLAESLSDGRISREEYLREFGERIDRIASRCEDILGRRDFEALFGVRPADMKKTIDREIFLSEAP